MEDDDDQKKEEDDVIPMIPNPGDHDEDAPNYLGPVNPPETSFFVGPAATPVPDEDENEEEKDQGEA